MPEAVWKALATHRKGDIEKLNQKDNDSVRKLDG